MIESGAESDQPAMRSTPAILFTLLSLLPACGDPCEPDDGPRVPAPFTDTSVIVNACHAPASTTGSTSGDGASETSSPTAETSGSSDDSTGPGLTCSLDPGTPWGPCDANTPCVDGEPGLCFQQGGLAVCVPLCMGDGCPQAACDAGVLKCMFVGGLELCIPACGGVLECPDDGMTCTAAGCLW